MAWDVQTVAPKNPQTKGDAMNREQTFWLFAALSALAVASGCGGAGSDDDEKAPVAWVTIESPTTAPSITTEGSSIELSGGAFVSPDKGTCCTPPPNPGVTVRWSSSTGTSGGTSQQAYFCDPFGVFGTPSSVCHHTWRATIPVAFGSNVIRVVASDGGRYSAAVTLTVVRADLTRPRVSSTTPYDNASSVGLNTTVVAVFSEEMDPATIDATTFSLRNSSGSPIAGTVTYSNRQATFTPSTQLAAATLYEATITVGAKDIAGNPLASSKVWTFATGLARDTTAPRIVSTTPTNGSSCAPLDAMVSVQFDKPVPSGYSGYLYLADASGNGIPGFAYPIDETRWTFDPQGLLSPSTAYSAVVAAGVPDAAGNATQSALIWNFATAPDGPGSWQRKAAAGAPAGSEVGFWTGDELLVLGYAVNYPNWQMVGGRYRPSSDTWTALSTMGAPSPRGRFNAVWTGAELLVWGGQSPDGISRRDGAIYDPATDRWRPMAALPAQLGGDVAASVWTGSYVLTVGRLGELAKYDMASDTWTPSSAPFPVDQAALQAHWTGTRLLVWGTRCTLSNVCSAAGASYDPSADSWSPVSDVGAPTMRSGFASAWTGSELAIWGGAPSGSSIDVLLSGALYNPVSDTWRPMSSQCASAAGSYTFWTGSELLTWTPGATGARYDPAADTWRTTSIMGAPASRLAKAVWTGRSLLVWSTDSIDFYQP